MSGRTHRYSNVILIPATVSNACLLLSSVIEPATLPPQCVSMLARGFSTFGTGAGFLAGANILQIASIGISAGLLGDNETMIAQAYGCVAGLWLG